jgi:iron complex transport system substrate-binding protein
MQSQSRLDMVKRSPAVYRSVPSIRHPINERPNSGRAGPSAARSTRCAGCLQDLLTGPRTARLGFSTGALSTVLLCALLTGCNRAGPNPAEPNLATTRPASRPAPQRVISLSPNVTEIIFALGQGSRLVGVSSYCTYPPEAARLPKCGGAMDTDLEKILTLRPDLIVIHGQHDLAARFCRQNGIPLLRVSPNDMETLYDAIRSIGKALGCAEQAECLVGKMKVDIGRVRAAVKGRPPVKVFLSISRSPDQLKSPTTTNGEGFISRMLEVAGGINIFAGTDVLYPTIVVGEIIRRQPEAIFELQPGGELTAAQRNRMVAQWRELGSIPAVRDNRVYFITEDLAVVAGPRVPLLAKRFAELLHPDLVGKLN